MNMNMNQKKDHPNHNQTKDHLK